MRYSIEPRERRYVKGYDFMCFARNFSYKYSKSLMDKRIDVSKKFAKTAGKKILKKKQQKQLEIKLVIRLLIRLQVRQKNHKMKKYSQMKYQTKDIFLLKKDKKLLMN